MLFPEEKKVYDVKIKGTKFIVTSESLPDTRQDILDCLTRLMVRDCGTIYDPNVKPLPYTPSKEEIEFYKSLYERKDDDDS